MQIKQLRNVFVQDKGLKSEYLITYKDEKSKNISVIPDPEKSLTKDINYNVYKLDDLTITDSKLDKVLGRKVFARQV